MTLLLEFPEMVSNVTTFAESGSEVTIRLATLEATLWASGKIALRENDDGIEVVTIVKVLP